MMKSMMKSMMRSMTRCITLYTHKHPKLILSLGIGCILSLSLGTLIERDKDSSSFIESLVSGESASNARMLDAQRSRVENTSDPSSHLDQSALLLDEVIAEVPLPRYRAQVIAALGRARSAVESRLGLKVPLVKIYLSRDDAAMRALAQRHHGHAPPSWSRGLAFSGLRQIYLPTTSALELDPLLRHELTHIALGARAEPHRVPLWINEGVAVALGEGLSPERVQALNEAATLGELSSFITLTRRFPEHGRPAHIAYAQAGHMISYLTQRVSVNAFQLWLGAICDGATPLAASERYLPRSLIEYERDWRALLDRGVLAWLGLFMQSETLWALGLLGFLVMGRRRIKQRRRDSLARHHREPTPQIRTAP